jgi:hypothetical protein
LFFWHRQKSPYGVVNNEFDIAIVGMAGRFPGAANVDDIPESQDGKRGWMGRSLLTKTAVKKQKK